MSRCAELWPTSSSWRVNTRIDHVRNVDVCRGTHVPDSSERRGRDGLDMYKGGIKMRPRERCYRWHSAWGRTTKMGFSSPVWGQKLIMFFNSRWKAKLRQTKAEMTRPGERGYGNKPDVNWDVRREKHWHVMIRAGTLLSVEVERWGENYIITTAHLEQLVSYLYACLVGETIVADWRHKDATVAARLYLDPERLLGTLLYTDVTRLTYLRSETCLFQLSYNFVTS